MRALGNFWTSYFFLLIFLAWIFSRPVQEYLISYRATPRAWLFFFQLIFVWKNILRTLPAPDYKIKNKRKISSSNKQSMWSSSSGFISRVRLLFVADGPRIILTISIMSSSVNSLCKRFWLVGFLQVSYAPNDWSSFRIFAWQLDAG